MPLTATQMRRAPGRSARVRLIAAPTLAGRVLAAVRTFATGANAFAAVQAQTGQTLGLGVSVTNGTAAPIVVNATASLYATGGSGAGIGSVNLGGTAYPVAANMTVQGQRVGLQSLAPGASATFNFTAPLAAVSAPMGVYVSVAVTDQSGAALPDSPLVAWSNAFLTVGTGATASAIGFGSPAVASLPAGGTLTMQGASVTVAGSPWWTLTVQAVDGAGSVLGQAQVLGQGSASGQSYSIGPLNEAGAQVSLRGSLQFYGDGGRTQALGAPVTASTGAIASTAVPVQVGSVSGLTATATGPDGFTLRWTPAGPYTEVQFTDAGGAQQLGVAIGSPYIGQGGSISGNGTTTFDRAATLVAGYAGLFTTDATAQVSLPPGTTAYVRARAASAIGSAATFGPWTAPVQVQSAPGQASYAVQGLLASTSTPTVSGPTGTWGPGTYSGPWPYVSLRATLTNTGNAQGYAPGWSAAIVDGNGTVQGVAGFTSPIALAPGQAYAIAAAVQLGNLGDQRVPPGGVYTVYVAPGQGYQNAGYSPGFSPFNGPVGGSVSVQVSV